MLIIFKSNVHLFIIMIYKFPSFFFFPIYIMENIKHTILINMISFYHKLGRV